MRSIAALLALLAALLAAGCGGGDDGSSAAPTGGGTTSGTAALSTEEFVERGDAICRDLRAKAAEIGKKAAQYGSFDLTSPRVYRQLAEIWRGQEQVVAELDRRFDALGPAPDGIAKQVDEFREDIDRAHALAQEIATALENEQDPSALVSDYAQLIDDSNATIQLAGFEVCGDDAA